MTTNPTHLQATYLRDTVEMPQKRSESAESHSDQDFSKFANEMRTMFKDFEGKISNRLKKIDDKFTSIFNELKEDINEVKAELSEVQSDVQNMRTQVDAVEKSIEFHAEKVSDIEREQNDKRGELESDLDEKIDSLNKKLMMLEKHERKYNLIFYGVSEEQGEKLYGKMRGFFVQNLKMEEERVKKIHFSNGHRLPSEYEGPRPVIMRFVSYEDRELVLSNASNLAGTGKKILTDLPVPMKKERQKLAKAAYGIRRNEKLKTRIRDIGVQMILEVRREANDRWVKRDV